MDRVWKETSLSNLGEEEQQGERKMMLQDFLAGERSRSGISSEVVGMLRPMPAAATTAPATTLLSLNSGCNEMHYLDWLGGFEPRVSSSSSSVHHPQHMVEPPGFGDFCRKRGSVMKGEDLVDRRQKRMIKNRESAARSRARKQAYTNELEIEIAHLVEENIKLKQLQQQQNQLSQMQEQQMSGKQAGGSQYKKEKPILRRTTTAPF